jgi:hypothetical protein
MTRILKEADQYAEGGAYSCILVPLQGWAQTDRGL